MSHNVDVVVTKYSREVCRPEVQTKEKRAFTTAHPANVTGKYKGIIVTKNEPAQVETRKLLYKHVRKESTRGDIIDKAGIKSPLKSYPTTPLKETGGTYGSKIYRYKSAIQYN